MNRNNNSRSNKSGRPVDPVPTSTKSGSQMRPIANPLAVQNQGAGNPPPPRTQLRGFNLNDFIDNYIKNIFKQKSYLETASMVTQLSIEHGFPENMLHRDEKVRNLLRLNKNVNLMIDVYERTNSILVYTELKDFIVSQMKAYLKSVTINVFEDLAIGYLFAHPKIVQMFGFPRDSKESNYTSNSVSKEMIFNIAKDFLNNQSKVDLKDESVQGTFTAFLRYKLKVEYDNTYGEGVVVIFKDIFHHLIKLKSLESRELIKVREASVKVFQDRAKESVSVLLGSLAVKKAKNKLKIIKEELLGKLKNKFNDATEFVRGLLVKGTEAGLQNELLSLLSGMSIDCCVLRDKRKAVVLQVQPTTEGEVQTLWNSIALLDKTCKLELCISSPPQRVLNHLLVNFLVLQCWLVLDNTEESWGYVEAGFDKESMELKLQLRSWVKELMAEVSPKPSIYVDESGKNVKSTLAFTDVMERLKAIVLLSVPCSVSPDSFFEVMADATPESLKKVLLPNNSGPSQSIECIRSKQFVALLAGSVILHHITATTHIVEDIIAEKKENLKKILPVLVKSAVRDANWLKAAFEPGAAVTLKPTIIVTKLLKDLEYKLLVAADVPTFEALRMSSYINAVVELQIEEQIEIALADFYPQWVRKDPATNGKSDVQKAEDLQLTVLTNSEICSLMDQTFSYLPSSLKGPNLNPAEVMLHLERCVVSQCAVDCFEKVSSGKSFLAFIQSAGCDEEVESTALKFLLSSFSEQYSGTGSKEALETRDEVDKDFVLNAEASALPRELIEIVVLQVLSEEFSHQKRLKSTVSLAENRSVIVADVTKHLIQLFQVSTSSVLSMIIEEIVDIKREEREMLTKHTADSPLALFLSDAEDVLQDSTMLENQAIEALLSVPVGVDCNSFTHWFDVFASHLNDGLTVPKFILRHSEMFNDRRSDVSYFCFDGGRNCVPVPKGAPSREQFASAWEQQNVVLLAGLFCGAVIHRHNNEAVNCTRLLFESMESVNKAVEVSVQIIGHLPSSLAVVRGVVRLLGEVVSQMQHISVDGAVKVISAQAVDSGDDVCIARLNALATLYPNEFEVVRSLPNPLISKSTVTAMDIVSSVDHSSYNQYSTAMANSTEVTLQSDLNSESFLGKAGAVSDEKKSLIDNFLRTDFGYNAAGQRPAIDGPQSTNLQKALDLLSASLYTSDVHFVMELLQNADDNTYADGIKPTLKFDLHKDALYLYNNEQGFKAEDIYSICKVGGSTKTVRAGVHIGQKGIGFKSVFSISDCPEVHSNGFHIRFNKAVSMLEPIWITESEHYRWPAHMQKFGDDGIATYFETCLRLQFDSKTRSEFTIQKTKIQEVLDEKLLLFLNKIKILEMTDHSSAAGGISRSALSKRDISSSWLYVTHQKFDSSFSDSYWLVKRHPFYPQCRRNDQVVERTEVAVAFKFNGSLLDTDDSSTGSNISETDGSQRRELTLDISDSLMKMYAFLPTSYGYFRFIVQGDFVLATNRESISENPWNQELFNQVPQLVVEMLEEFSLWAWKSVIKDGPSEVKFPHLGQLLESAYKVSLTIPDVLHLLPRLSNVRNDERRIVATIHAIYDKLREVKFLCSQSGHLCISSDLVYVDHLAFKPSKYIPEEELWLSVGKRYLHNNVEYDPELFELLGIQVFNENHVLACCRKFESELMELNENSQDHNLRMVNLSRLLLILSKLTSEELNQSSAKAAKRNVGPEPRQVALHKLRATVGTVNKTSKVVQSEVLKSVRALKIWPVIVGKQRSFVSLQTHVVLIYASSHISQNLQVCVDVFKQYLPMMDESLLRESEKLEEGRSTLLEFLVQKLASAHGTGGIEHLSVEVILKTFIVNRYETLDVGTWDLDRRTTSAMLAFLFISSVMKNCKFADDPAFKSNLTALTLMLKKTNVVVPTLSVRNKDKHKIVWSASTMRVVQKPAAYSAVSDDDVHLGVEFADSATNVFAATAMSTALRQMNWTIIDPLAASFLFDMHRDAVFQFKSAEQDQGQNAGFLIHEEVQIVLARVKFQEVIKMWKLFLHHIGVIDFFGVYNQNNDINTPALFKFLGHYLARAKPAVRIDSGMRGNSWIQNNGTKVSEEQSIEDDFDNDELDENLSLLLYVPKSETVVVDAPLVVSKNTHKILMTVANLILRELSYMKSSDSKLWLLSELSRRAWFPVEVKQPGVKIPIGLALVASPLSVFHCTLADRLSSTWYPMGQHVMYKPEGIVFDRTSDLKLKLYEHSHYEMDEVMKLFVWMTQQPPGSMFYSNLLWMNDLYSRMFTEYFDTAKITSEVSQQIMDVIIREQPFLWFPESAADPKAYVDDTVKSGKLFPLKDVFERDFTTTLIFRKSHSVHRSLLDSYDALPGDKKLSPFFARRRCCQVCNAVEGMFGVKGQIVGSEHGKIWKCTCIESPLAKLTSVQAGLINKSPTLNHTLNLMLQYQDEYLNLLHTSAPTEVTQSILDTVLQTLENISREIWKCFNIEGCLHAYSKQTLKMLRDRCQTEKFLPSVDNQQFYSLKKVRSISESNVIGCSGSEVSDAESEKSDSDEDDADDNNLSIAVDDIEVFDVFRGKLDRLKHVQWVNGRVSQTEFFPVVAVNTSANHSWLYDLDRFGDSCLSLLNSPSFKQLADTIPPLTFYAPLDLLALYRFLGIESLSKHVSTKWNVVKAESAVGFQAQNVVGTTVLELINKLLLIVQTMLNTKASDIAGYNANEFTKTERMKTLLSVDVIDCSALSRSLVLELEGIAECAELAQDYHYDPVSNTLNVSQSISKVKKIKLCSDFVLSAVRIELSLINKNQNLEILAKCKELITKIADQDIDTILNYLRVEYTLPENTDRWRIAKELMTSDVAESDESEESDSDRETDDVASKALENLNTMSKLAVKPAVSVVKPRDEKFTSFLAEKEIKDRLGVLAPNEMQPYRQSIEVPATLQSQLDGGSSISGQSSYQQSVTSRQGGTNTASDVGPRLISVTGPASHSGDAQLFDEVVIDRRYDNGFNTAASVDASINVPNPLPLMSEAYLQHLRSNVAVEGFDNSHLMRGPVPLGAFPTAPGHAVFSKPSVGLDSLNVNVEISRDVLQELGSVRQIPDPRLQEFLVSGNGNALSGRLGEMIAFRHLQEKLRGQLEYICWMNGIEEQGLPFDIDIMFIGGRRKRCEVKARICAPGVSINQWHISANEVSSMQRDPDYFAMFFALELAPDLSKLQVCSCNEVGFEGGLWSVIESGGAGFIIQMN